MRREEVIDYVNEQLDAAGVPDCVRSVRPVPAQVAVDVMIGAQRERVLLRTGITRAELQIAVAKLRAKWDVRSVGGKQADLEDAIAAQTAGAIG